MKPFKLNCLKNGINQTVYGKFRTKPNQTNFYHYTYYKFVCENHHTNKLKLEFKIKS